MPPRFAVRDIAFFERPVRLPGRSASAPWSSTRRRSCSCGSRSRSKARAALIGASAELLVPKWFDKRPHLSPDETVDELRRSLVIARELYLAHSGFETAFGLHAACIGAQVEACAREDIPPLAAAYGPAEIDKAILDALLRAVGVNFFDGMAGNIAGIDARLSPDLGDEDIAQFLAESPAAGTCRDPAYRRPRRQDRRRGRCRRRKGKCRRALFQAQAQRRSRARCGATDPDRKRARLRCRTTTASRWMPTSNMPISPRSARWSIGSTATRADADRDEAALYRAADAARHHPAIAAGRAGRAAISSSTRPTIPTTRFRRRGSSAIAASPRNPARASTSRSSTRRAPPNGARAAKNSSSLART